MARKKGKFARAGDRDSGSHDTGIETNPEDGAVQHKTRCKSKGGVVRRKGRSSEPQQEDRKLDGDADDESEEAEPRGRQTYKNASDGMEVSGNTQEAGPAGEGRVTGEIVMPQDGEFLLGPDLRIPCDATEDVASLDPASGGYGVRKRLKTPLGRQEASEGTFHLGPPKQSSASSSCESDKEDGRTSQKPLDPRCSDLYSPSSRSAHLHKTNEVPSSEMEEWEETGATDITSDSSDSDNASTSSSRLDEAEEEGRVRKQNVHHVASIMSNLASSTAKVSCVIWEGDEVQKVDLTVLDVGWTIIKRVRRIPEKADYLVLGVALSLLLLFMPCAFRLYHCPDDAALDWTQPVDALLRLPVLFTGRDWRQRLLVCNGAVQRFALSLLFFFLLSVVERTFKQRLLYAKHFCYLTSSRRSKKYELPHFRLNKVRNIKIWLSLRSYLKRCGPQRSVDSIVSASFMLAVLLVSIMCLQLLHGYGSFLDQLGNWELALWALALSLYLLRFMTLGTKINRKYRHFAVLITEQINLYLHMEQKPHKKEELMLANSVLKLAEDLLKELESPFKISGLSANPFLYNVTKVIVLSAFSAVLTELLGFKLKLYKIKLRA